MYRVVWSQVALDQLADIFVLADLELQRRMADAVEALNRHLELRPFDEGESRDGSGRVVFVQGGLVVGFSVNEPIQEVRVVGVTQYGR